MAESYEVELSPMQLWQGRVAEARSYQKSCGNSEERWSTNVKALAGDFNSENELGEDAIDVNMIRAHARTTLPPFYTVLPYITVTPRVRRYRDRDNVKLAEGDEREINYWMEELRVRQQVRKVLLDAETTNLGYLYVGRIAEARDVRVKDRAYEPSPEVRQGQPFIRRHSPRSILVPPGYWDLEDAPWVGIEFLRPLSDVRARYPETTKDLQCEEYGLNYGDSGLGMYDRSPERGIVRIIDIWDKGTRKVYKLVPGYEGSFLEDPKGWPYDLDGFPLAQYRPEEIPDEYYGTPPTSYALPQNKELNATRTAMRARRNRKKAIIAVRSDVGEEVHGKYADAEDGLMLKTDVPSDQRMGDAFFEISTPDVESSDLAYDNLIKQDLMEQTGLGSEQRGAGDPNVDSATASQNISRGVQVRQSDPADRVADLYTTVARKLWILLHTFPNKERSTLIVGPDLAEISAIKIPVDDLRGQFNFSVNFAGMLNDTPASRQRQAILNYNMFRADPLINPERLILEVFETQNKLHPEDYLLRLRTPEEEIAMIAQGLPVEAHERDAHTEHMQKHEQQAEMLDRALQTNRSTELRVAQILLGSHVQSHARIMLALQGRGREPGTPVSENLLRNSMSEGGGGETRAELAGQPLGAQSGVA